MEISELTLKLIILLIPGAVASVIVEKLTVHKAWNSFQFILNSILLGFSSYLLLQLFYFLVFLFLTGDNTLKIWSSIVGSSEIPYLEIIQACLLAFGIGLFVTDFVQKKRLNKMAKWLKISFKYGEENLYSYFLNLPEVTEVYIRVKSKGLTYHGIVDSFSETDSINEIVLKKVAVYRYKDSEPCYESDVIYLSLPKDQTIIIEVPKI